jgi:KDO2-lipid IV(A) lauroyltransferase
MAPATPRGVRMLVKALKRGHAVGILPDQVPSGGEGVWAPFFGKPAYTMSLVHRLHQLTSAPVVAVFAERLPHGQGYRGHLRIVNGDGMLPADPAAAAAAINATIQALIAEAPTQYLWGYHRYKTPAGAPEPDTGDVAQTPPDTPQHS